MACPLVRPDPQELFDRIKSSFSTTVLGGYDVVPESLEWYVVSNDYAMQEAYYTISEQQWRAKDPRYACCEDLYDLAALDGMYPHPAGFARGYVKVTGAPGTEIPNPLEILFGGSRFIVVGGDGGEIQSSGYAVLAVQAIVPGNEGNKAPKYGNGVVLDTSTGLSPVAEPYGSKFCGGSKAEECEHFRTRYLRHRAHKPRATYSWIIDKIMEFPCVTRVVHREGACCDSTEPCDCNDCVNSLEFYPLFDSTFDCGIPPQCIIDDMNLWLFGEPQGRGLGQVEIGVCGKLYAAVPHLVNVRIAGLACATMNQLDMVKERVKDIMGQAIPSQILQVRTIETAISQVMGDFGTYNVAFEDVTGGMPISPCGDLIPECDVLPCLNEIIIANALAPISSCSS